MAMEKTYQPAQIEEKWYKIWEEKKVFHGDSASGGEKYCVVIPPPNITGILHMGHALNNTIQDILVRWRRMQGRNVVWMPGTDHAGIATQNVVEKSLRKEGKTRQDLGREAFIGQVWKWREVYGNTIIHQLKKLGSACDWDRLRFTMDDGLSNAVTEVFVRLYEKGLIYRGNYIINWCPRCHTALSDEESEHVDTNGKLYYIRYPVKDAGKGGPAHVIVATTRPETLLGDVAVAMNARDKRYAGLASKTLLLPILNRELVVIQDDIVDPAFGTGLVKVTPAHDPNDFAMAQRHKLEPINIMNGDGTMNGEAGPYAGMDRFDCRKKILQDLEAAGLIEKIEDHAHAVGHCYRCDTVVEPRLSLQWFVKMKPLAGPAIEAMRSGKIKFVPARWNKVYMEWMENIRDWCISRQIWWGHRIPVFYCDACGAEWAAKGTPAKCPKCGSTKFRQDEDVLDTWFSSWLWPFSTFGWPEMNRDLKFYYPTNDLVTASEIIFFWVSRMIMAGLEFMGDIPFNTVYIHGTVRDDHGRKMSKSLGNSVDPLAVIKDYSADALRFSLTMLTATGQDVYISNKKFEIGRNFGTKIWNAARFMKMHSEGFAPDGLAIPSLNPALLSRDDCHILARLNDAIDACRKNLEEYRFNDAALVLYEFVWHQYCDWYLEAVKDTLYGTDPARKEQVLKIMHFVFSNALRLLHPIMPFLTEELWHDMGYASGADTFIMHAPWPVPFNESLARWGIDASVVQYVDDKHELIRAGRMLRADYQIPPAKKVGFIVKPADEASATMLRGDLASLQSLLRSDEIRIEKDFEPESAMPSGLGRLGVLYMPLQGLVDVEGEKKRLTGQLMQISTDLERVNAKLMNMDFVKKAKREIVEQQESRKKELTESGDKLKSILDTLNRM